MNLAKELTVLRKIFNDPLLHAYSLWRGDTENGENYNDFLSVLYEAGAQDDFAAYFEDAVRYDDNAFSRACAEKSVSDISPFIKKAFERDLDILKKGLSALSETGDFHVGKFDLTASGLAAFYRKNGYGDFARYKAFRYFGKLLPVLAPAQTALSDLKGYAREKAEITENVENFLEGLPFSDMLLYGERGTGKSSTVHAVLNAYSARKLRLIELAKEDILKLPALKSYLAKIPMKFMVFIDDFSLAEDDERLSSLKACLQGSSEGLARNVMIVATSNRRHIVEENFSTRNNSIHGGDSENELLSLSDRFGLCVLFAGVKKEEYLAIVRETASDRGLRTPPQEIERLAERWAIAKGGRSPRRAIQFLDALTACERKGKPLEC